MIGTCYFQRMYSIRCLFINLYNLLISIIWIREINTHICYGKSLYLLEHRRFIDIAIGFIENEIQFNIHNRIILSFMLFMFILTQIINYRDSKLIVWTQQIIMFQSAKISFFEQMNFFFRLFLLFILFTDKIVSIRRISIQHEQL